MEMSMNENAMSWSEAQKKVHTDMVEGGGKPGIATLDQLLGLSGRQVLEGMMSGTLPHPHMNDSLDLDLMEVGDGHAVFQGVPDLRYFNPMGTVHGGWYSTLLDSALGCPVQSKLPVGRAYTTAELSINIVRPSTQKTGPLRAIADVIHVGKQMATAEARVVDEAGRLYAHATTTCFVFDMPAGAVKSVATGSSAS
jgi:uncharacterized protein (TIGR00369 family)